MEIRNNADLLLLLFFLLSTSLRGDKILHGFKRNDFYILNCDVNCDMYKI